MRVEPLWKRKTGGTIRDVSFSSKGADVAAASFDGNVYLFSGEGELLWKYLTKGQVRDVFLTPKYLAATSEDGGLYFFDRAGKLLWKCQTGARSRDIATTREGVYTIGASDDSHAYLIDKQGKLMWKYKTGGWVGRVAISANAETIVAGSVDHYVYSLDLGGNLLWRYRTGSWIESIVTTEDGKYVVAGSNDGKVYLFQKDGTLLWNFDATDPVTRVRCSSDCNTVACSTETGIYLFNKRGDVLWHHTIGDFDVRGLRLDGAGAIVGMGSRKNEIEVLGRARKSLWKYKTDCWVEAIDVNAEGRYICAGLQDGSLLFFDQEKMIKEELTKLERQKVDLRELRDKLDSKNYEEVLYLINKLSAKIVEVGRCPRCAEPVEESWMFCPHCGRKLGI